MQGPIYFGKLTVSGSCEKDMFATDKADLEKDIHEEWTREVRNVLKFIADSKLDMPLMRQVLLSAEAHVTTQEYAERKSA